MTRQVLGISKYAVLLIGQEREFGKWLFNKKFGLHIEGETIKRKHAPEETIYYLVRSGGFLPLRLSQEEHTKLQQEWQRSLAGRFTYEELEMMLIEETARRIHAEWAYRHLVSRGLVSPTWNELSEEDRDGYREEIKERVFYR